MIVAVYGTLRKGQPNHHLLGNSAFLGTASLPSGYVLTVAQLPFLTRKNNGLGALIELYSVDAATLSTLDYLEGHPNMYIRTPITIMHNNSPLEVFVYLYNGTPPKGDVTYDYSGYIIQRK